MADSDSDEKIIDFNDLPSTSTKNTNLLPDDRVFEDVNDIELLQNESEVEISIANFDDHDSPQPTILSPIDQFIDSPPQPINLKSSAHSIDDQPQEILETKSSGNGLYRL